jgi:tRNA pseudouridine13 synthase
MRESWYPLERALGMDYYASDTPGIGGRLREIAEDFVVDEVLDDIGKEGPFLICRLTKRDWDQQRAIREIGKRLGISYKRIGFAGTKDKHAVTSQFISIQVISEEDLQRVDLRDIRLEAAGRAHSPITLGSHTANRFSITIRDAAAPDLVSIVEGVTGVCRTAVPNYFGIQRFGVIRPLTHIVGRFILRQDYENAVLSYTGEAFPGEPDEVRMARSAYQETRDARAALREFPLPLSYERSLLHHLAVHPGDYRGALAVLPPKLLSMFISAYQSYLFNRALSRRIADRGDLLDPLPGDLLLFTNGREDRVTEQNKGNASLLLRRGRGWIALRMPGCSNRESRGHESREMAGLLEEDGIRHDDFCAVRDLVKMRFEGASRAISLSTAVTAAPGENFVHLSFTLSPGQYATTICREYMKADPLVMI